MARLILALDSAGAPNRWIDVEAAAHYYAKQQVAWAVGEHEFTLHGGVSRLTGVRSLLRLNSIIAVAGRDFRSRWRPRSICVATVLRGRPRRRPTWSCGSP